MSKSLPPLSWLLAFDTAARHQSMTAAARELGLTQSAISQQIRLLEHRFGKRLFTRHPKGLTLTDHGRRLLPQIAESIDALSHILTEFDVDQSVRPLDVATSMSFARCFVSPFLPAFLERHPEARFRFRNALWPDDFARSESDIEIRFTSAKRAGSAAKRLYEDRVISVCAPGCLPANATWEDIGSVHRFEIVGTQQRWDRWSAALGRTAPEGPVQIVDSHGLAIDMARAGAGVTLSNLLLVMPHLLDGSLVIPVPDWQPAHETYYLTVNPDTPHDLAPVFATWIEEQIDRLASQLAASQKSMAMPFFSQSP